MAPRKHRVSVVVVDDHAVVRAGVRTLLGVDPNLQIVGESSDVASALRVVAAEQPDVLLLDLNLPDGSGLDALAPIAAAAPRTRIIILTMQEGPAFASRALAAGAHGYLLKEAAETELLTALHAVMGGATYLDPRVGAALASNAELERRDPVLTDRERQVVRLLAMGRTNAQVAEALHFSERTIESCRAQVREKLGLRDRAGLTEYARANGLLEEVGG